MNVNKFVMVRLVLVFGLFSILTQCKKDEVIIDTPSNFTVPAVEDIVMYEINTAAFSATHNFAGITARMDSLKTLGINTIWLMPIYTVGVLDAFGSPYCVKDYTGIKTSFGTLNDLNTLVDAAHARGIAVILDWVANHTSWDNAWITNPGWYSTDGSGNIISPPGTTWTDVADLNFDNADMRLAMIDAMEYWIDNAHIDGFRCDAADFVPFDFWKQAIDSLHAHTTNNLILLAEGSRADHFTAGFQLNFSWSYLGMIKNIFEGGTNAYAIYTTNTSEYSVVPAGAQKLRFITNHDETNIAPPLTVFGSQDAALAAEVITMYLQGVPLIYCGQEVGVSSSSTYNGFNYINWSINPDIYSAYKQLLRIYNQNTALRSGNLETYSDPDFVCFRKYLTDESVLVIVNADSSSKTFTIPASLQDNYTNLMDNTTINLGSSLDVSAYGWFVLKK